METKHTKGPWEVGSDAARENLIPVFGAGKLVAHTAHTRQGYVDARLIAAAPDLLDALTDLVGGMGKEGNLYADLDKARAAIAKALGE